VSDPVRGYRLRSGFVEAITAEAVTVRGEDGNATATVPEFAYENIDLTHWELVE
jgi:hypothetical protein